MYDADSICWHDHRDNSWRCGTDHRSDLHFYWGRRRSGKRWFWAAHLWFSDDINSYGWEDSEVQAIAAAHTAIKQTSNGRKAAAYFSAGTAGDRLQAINKSKRAAKLATRPSSAKHSKVVEYLYAHQGCNGEMSEFCPCHRMNEVESWNYHVCKFAIIKKTERQIYYDRRPLDFVKSSVSEFRNVVNTTDYHTGYVDRQKIEQDGEIWTRKWWQSDSHLHLTPPPPPDWRRGPDGSEPVNIQKLKAEMAAAHPDRGGSSAAFIAARERYLQARRAVAQSRETTP